MIKIEMYSDYDGVWVNIDAPENSIKGHRFNTADDAREFIKQWLNENYWRC